MGGADYNNVIIIIMHVHIGGAIPRRTNIHNATVHNVILLCTFIHILLKMLLMALSGFSRIR